MDHKQYNFRWYTNTFMLIIFVIDVLVEMGINYWLF